MPNSKKMNVDLNNSTDINKTPTSGGSKSITETSRNTGTSGTSNASNTSKDNIRSEINKGLSNCSDPDLKSDPKKRPELKPEHKPIEEHTSSNHYLKPDRR